MFEHDMCVHNTMHNIFTVEENKNNNIIQLRRDSLIF